MGVRCFSSADGDMSALYDSVTDIAFGPIFYNVDGDADEFLEWYNERYSTRADDLRRIGNDAIYARIAEWRRARIAAQDELPFPEIPF